MARKLSDIAKSIQNSEPLFQDFLKEELDAAVYSFLTELSEIDNLYLFSGIIRDYFLGIKGIRDIDIMIDSVKNIAPVLEKYNHRRNSFGGFKLSINGMAIDLWYLKETWALNNSQKVIDIDVEKYIPNTSFFNFSSIIYSFRDNKFIYSKFFLRFLRDKKIDYVFTPNPSYALCVVNSFYYHDKLHMKFTDRLKKHLIKLNSQVSSGYDEVQLKHFGRIIYDKICILNRIKELKPNE